MCVLDDALAVGGPGIDAEGEMRSGFLLESPSTKVEWGTRSKGRAVNLPRALRINKATAIEKSVRDFCNTPELFLDEHIETRIFCLDVSNFLQAGVSV
jgi:hypothetical protein